jgi:hypothetical protein
MKRRYQEGGEVDAMEEANSRSMLTPRKVSIGSADEASEDDNLKKRAMERSRLMQQDISAGSDFIGRSQDEGYRPYVSPEDRDKLEGGDAKVAERASQSSGIAKPTPKATPKAKPKSEARDTGSDMARMMNRAKAVSAPVDETKLSANERTKRSIERNLSSARSGSGSTDKRSVTDRIKASFGMKSGGMTASSRGDGIAQRGKTRGKMC